MNKREAWQRIPLLVHRYGPCAARAVCDVVGGIDDSGLLDLIIQADACALYGELQKAAQLYVRASQSVKHDTCLRQVSTLLESAVYCDPSHMEIRMQLIQALHTGCSFWRAGEHLQLLADFDCSKISLSRWVSFFSQLSIEPQMQAGLLRCYIWLAQHFTRIADQQQIREVVLDVIRSAKHAWYVCWQEHISKCIRGQYRNDKVILSSLVQK